MNNELKTLSIIIPALNEEEGVGLVIKSIPFRKIKKMGYEVEVLVVDNNSSDNTAIIAKNNGANVITASVRGYGNAYKIGFANAKGEIIVTGDADLTYPFEVIPKLLLKIEREKLDFINTDRLTNLNKTVMPRLHRIGNIVLTFLAKQLFELPFNDSQSGMWIFRRSIWKKIKVKSSGMSFSQELKIEVFVHGFKCAEIPIDYRMRVGRKKINTILNGMENIGQLIGKKIFTKNR